MDFRQFITQVNQTYKEEDELYRRLARYSGLSEAAFWILYTVELASRPITQAEVCGYLSLSKQTINSALKQLEQTGHIRLTDGPGRKKYLQLTETGRTLSQRTIGPVLALEERTFLGLTEEERASLLALERKYLSLLLQESEQIFQRPQEE